MANRAETRGLLRLPVRAERPGDVFNPSVLSVRWVPGRRILSNAIPANGLSAPTFDRSEDAECNAPPNGVLVGGATRCYVASVDAHGQLPDDGGSLLCGEFGC
jgi:hypothetical protein